MADNVPRKTTFRRRCRIGYMYEAIKNGDTTTLYEMLQYGPDINVKMGGGLTPLHFSIRESELDCFNLLLGMGADVNVTDNKGMNSLHHAAQNGNTLVLNRLLDRGCDVNAQDHKGRTALYIALEAENLDCVKALLSTCKTLNLDIRDADGRSPLSISVENGYNDIVNMLLHLKASVNSVNMYDNSPLLIAVKQGNLECVDALLGAGADLNVCGDNNNSSLHVAAENKHGSVIKYLIDLGFNLNKQNNDNNTALHLALKKRSEDIAEALIDAGADVDIVNHYRLTPLHFAADYECTKIWRKLLEMKPKVLSDHDSFERYSLFRFIIRNNREDYFDDLLKSGVNIGIKDDNGNSVLHMAAQFGETVVLKRLMQFNLDINAQNRHGCTPLHTANHNHKFLDQILVLLDAGAKHDIRGYRGELMLEQFMHYIMSGIDNYPGMYPWVEVQPKLKKILERVNDGIPVCALSLKSAAHIAVEYMSQYTIELIKLVISTQKVLNVKDGSGLTVLNNITIRIRWIELAHAEQLVQTCIEHGEYLNSYDCDIIIPYIPFRDIILSNVDFCVMNITNKFNNYTLQQFYECLDNKTPFLRKCDLEIIPGSTAWHVIQQDVKDEIERNGYCNVSDLVTTLLSKQCVEAYCNAFYSKPLPKNILSK